MNRYISLLSLVLAFALVCAGQTSTSQISGTVRDSSGAIIPGAAVTLTNEATGVVQKQSTTDAGVYAFAAIPVGSYMLRVEAAGFKILTRPGNVVQVNTPLAVDITME